MKSSRKSETKQSHQGHTNVPKPDIRDDMDSRKDKEDGYKGVSYRPEKKPKKKMEKPSKGGPEPFIPKKNGQSW